VELFKDKHLNMNVRLEKKKINSRSCFSFFLLENKNKEVNNMEINYKNYEPNQGLEEIQAKLYSMNNNREVKGEDIQKRFEEEKIDPKSVLYAFTENNEPLGYVQARDYPQLGQIHMGRPWTTPECPEEVKDKLFNELFSYMVSRKSDLNLLLNTNNDPKLEKLALEKEMKLDRNVIQFEFDINSLSQFDATSYNYSIRKATIEDLDIIKRCRNLAYSQDPDDNNERMLEFLKTTIETGYFYLIFDENTLIGACASRKPADDDETMNLGVGPVFTLLEKEEAIIILFKNALTVAHEAGWKKDHISIGYTDENDREMKIIRSAARKEEKTSTRYITQ
jgi:hypothetical protein